MDADAFSPPFNVEDYIEKTTFLTLGGIQNNQHEFDPAPLVTAFEEQISALYELNAQVAHDIVQLEKDVTKKEHRVAENIVTLGDQTKQALSAFEQLSSGTQGVSQKIVHVGDSLESKHQQRNRAVDTRTVMEHFNAFQVPNGPRLPPFVGENVDLHACAHIIQKLDFISSQLKEQKSSPNTATTTAQRIAAELKKTEKQLLAEFNKSSNDPAAMRAYARTLFPFKSYDRCVKGFIANFILERKQLHIIHNDITGVLSAIEAACSEAKGKIEEVFKYSDPVTVSFVQTIVSTVLGKFISNHIVVSDEHADSYLDRLHRAYCKTQTMLKRLALKLNVSDPGGVLKGNLLRNVFEDYLQNYMQMEEGSLKSMYNADVNEALAAVLPHKGGQRDASSFSTSPRIKKKKGKNIEMEPTRPAPRPIDLLSNGGLLNMDVVLSMIHENKLALKRCEALMSSSALPDFANRIFQKLLEELGLGYMKPALEVAMETISGKGSTVQSNTMFLNVVEDINNAVYFLMKYFWDTVLPLVRPSIVVYQVCVNQKDSVLIQLETLISAGLNQSMRAIVVHCGVLLSKKQKRSDFSPDDADMSAFDRTCTEACEVCCQVLSSYTQAIKKGLNGKNEDILFFEFGNRVHQMLLDHIKVQNVNPTGAMLVVRDVSKYADCCKEFNNKQVDQLFSDLKEASSILICTPEVIKNFREEQHISMATMQLFAKLRSDYKEEVAILFTDLK